jgi:hypothetical protein
MLASTPFGPRMSKVAHNVVVFDVRSCKWALRQCERAHHLTVCLRKINDRWMITHEHDSVPFDSKSGLGLVRIVKTKAADLSAGAEIAASWNERCQVFS